jgi:autotransporter-associated beta strand protein
VGGLGFSNSSTAGSASIDNSYSTVFFNTSTAGSAFIFNHSLLSFADSSTAGSAHILNDDQFVATMSFSDSSSAGSALIESIGYVAFNASSQGGTARIILSDPPGGSTGILDIRGHNPPGVTIGSIESGIINNSFPEVFLGANNLTVGSNNLSTIFSGIVDDGGLGGSLTKIGDGTLALTGTNTYDGDTTVESGTLLINGDSTGATGAVIVDGSDNENTVLGGTGTVGGAVTVNFGAILGGTGATAGETLTVNNSLTLNPDSIIELALGPAGAHSTLARTAGTWSFQPAQMFTFIDFGATPGTYDNIITGLASDPGTEGGWIITNAGYAGTFAYDGSGNIDLTLTAVAGTPTPTPTATATSTPTRRRQRLQQRHLLLQPQRQRPPRQQPRRQPLLARRPLGP